MLPYEVQDVAQAKTKTLLHLNNVKKRRCKFLSSRSRCLNYSNNMLFALAMVFMGIVKVLKNNYMSVIMDMRLTTLLNQVPRHCFALQY